jgi:hypothetical protein
MNLLALPKPSVLERTCHLVSLINIRVPFFLGFKAGQSHFDVRPEFSFRIGILQTDSFGVPDTISSNYLLRASDLKVEMKLKWKTFSHALLFP